MKAHYSIDYEYDYILRFGTFSMLSNKSQMTMKSQIQKYISTERHLSIYWTTNIIRFYIHLFFEGFFPP